MIIDNIDYVHVVYIIYGLMHDIVHISAQVHVVRARARSINYYIITHVHHVVGLKYKKNAMNKIKRGYILIEGGVYIIDAACMCGVYTRKYGSLTVLR